MESMFQWQVFYKYILSRYCQLNLASAANESIFHVGYVFYFSMSMCLRYPAEYLTSVYHFYFRVCACFIEADPIYIPVQCN